MKSYYVYILSNKNLTVLYIGVTNNLIERVQNHKNGFGSIFTKKYSLTHLLYYEKYSSSIEAIKREKQVKKWNRAWKWELIKKQNPDLIDLFEYIRG